MFTVLHVLLYSSAMLNPIQSYHPCSREYTGMQRFAMHCFQGCRGSLKSVSKILGVICSPLLHWSSQFYMWCSIAQHCWTLTASPHPHSREYTDVQPFAMHHFWGGRVSLNWFIIILGVNCPLLLHWCSQFCMWCSTTRHCWTLTTSTYPYSCEYTDVQPFAMHHFRGGRASLNWFIIILGWAVHRCYTNVRSDACTAQ